MLISLTDVTKSFGEHVILQDVTLKIEDQDRVGVVGVNGAGKSTLLNLIHGDLEPDVGEVSRKNGIRIGFLRQNSGLNRDNSIIEELRLVFEDLLLLQEELRRLGEAIAEAAGDEARLKPLSEEYAAKQADFEHRDGYQIDVKINTILNGMGFGDRDRNTMINTLSGGEKTRLALCKLLLEEPDLLILDEPTNHLDFRTMQWLEDYLTGYRGALLIVSHDRYFLDTLVTSIWDVERHRVSDYRGNYTKFVGLKQERYERQLKEYEIQQAQIADLKDYVARNLVRATTASRAKSKQNALDRMELVEKPAPPLKAAKLQFEYDKEPVREVLRVSGLRLAVGEGSEEKLLCESIDFTVRRGEKIAIIGANGVGKSSFLKVIQGLLPYQRGEIEWGKNVSISYYEQEHTSLHPEKTVLDEIWDRFPRQYEHTVRTMLGCVLLTGENVYKQVGRLSGGERAKLRFAIMMMERCNLLILDEPTNHLDLNTKEVLDAALSRFTGTVIMVSHDRYLLNKCPTKIVEMYPDHLEWYEGNYSAYLAKKAQARPQAAPEPRREPTPEKEGSTAYYRSKKQRSEEVARKKRIESLEDEIEQTEIAIARLEDEIAMPEVASNYCLLSEKCSLIEQQRDQLAVLIDEWTTLSEP